MTPADCEGNYDIYAAVITMLHRTLLGIDVRFGYLAVVPYAFVRADTVAGAKEALRQVRATEWLKHDPLTRIVMDSIGGDLERRANGEEASQALLDWVAAFKLCLLDESYGEGYHAKTHYEKGRARASKQLHLKQSTRCKVALERTKALIKRYGDRAKRVVRHDWRTWKRIVHKPGRHQRRPVRASADQVLDEVYRQDERTRDDFTLICKKGALRGGPRHGENRWHRSVPY